LPGQEEAGSASDETGSETKEERKEGRVTQISRDKKG
jgi:hypothetical protein